MDADRVVQHPHLHLPVQLDAQSPLMLTSVASAYLRSWYCFVPSGTSLRGLKVRVLPLRSTRYQKPARGLDRALLQAKKRRHADKLETERGGTDWRGIAWGWRATVQAQTGKVLLQRR